jgi:hypothetical protein
MSQLELNKLTQTPISSLRNIENDETKTKATSVRTLERIKTVLEDKGVRFLPAKEKDSLHDLGVRIWLERE